MTELQMEVQKDFSYNPTTGVLKRKFSKGCKGGSTGTLSHGYLMFTWKGKVRRAHRLIWLYHYGTWPQGEEMDHINGIKTDNRIENLRDVSRSTNRLNSYVNRFIQNELNLCTPQ